VAAVGVKADIRRRLAPMASVVLDPEPTIHSPEQLVAVHIPLAPFQDPDHCETMPCVVLNPGQL